LFHLDRRPGAVYIIPTQTPRPEGTMVDLRAQFARHWWVILLRGLFAILFGILAFAYPGITLASLVMVYGIFVLADGLVALFGGMGNSLWPSLLVGLVGVAAGLLTFFYPGITALVLLYFIAAWAIVKGVFEIVIAFKLREVIQGEWALILAGALSVAFGVLVFLFPQAGALSVIWIIGAYALAFGVLLVLASLKIRKLAAA
jgi:uncharacterized membrane protein HdeD (DUF308 family)